MKRTLIEIAATAALLVIVSIIAAQMFLKANTMQKMARDIDLATLVAQAVIEKLKVGRQSEGIFYYDRDFSPVSAPNENGFAIDVSITDEGGGLYGVTVSVKKLKQYFGTDVTEVLSLNTSIYGGDIR